MRYLPLGRVYSSTAPCPPPKKPGSSASAAAGGKPPVIALPPSQEAARGATALAMTARCSRGGAKARASASQARGAQPGPPACIGLGWRGRSCYWRQPRRRGDWRRRALGAGRRRPSSQPEAASVREEMGRVKYDDGEVEDLTLANERIQFSISSEEMKCLDLKFG
ncbi:hypothetical protein ZWY2020_044192 [Hordeum vulgare]|nr:hypothetical protein ZWY2020_044192 [Hordeum vulgare]